MAKTSVVYFYANGTTAHMTKVITKAADADMYETQPVEAYIAAELN